MVMVSVAALQPGQKSLPETYTLQIERGKSTKLCLCDLCIYVLCTDIIQPSAFKIALVSEITDSEEAFLHTNKVGRSKKPPVIAYTCCSCMYLFTKRIFT